MTQPFQSREGTVLSGSITSDAHSWLEVVGRQIEPADGDSMLLLGLTPCLQLLEVSDVLITEIQCLLVWLGHAVTTP